VSGSLFLSIRALHILLAALWLGAVFLLSMFVMPAVREAGPTGSHFLATLHRRKLGAFMATIGVLTVLSGLWLYWVFTAGLSEGVMLSHGGMAFGIGGLLGLLAAVLGGGMVGRGFARIIAMSEQTAALPEAERSAHQQTLAALRTRTSMASKCVLVLMIAALLLMAVGHYV